MFAGSPMGIVRLTADFVLSSAMNGLNRVRPEDRDIKTMESTLELLRIIKSLLFFFFCSPKRKRTKNKRVPRENGPDGRPSGSSRTQLYAIF